MLIDGMAKKECKCGCGMHALCIGLGIFVLGLVKYLGYSWEMALMAIGALVVLKGLLVKMACKCK